MSLLDHLTELRNRLVFGLGGVVVGFVACWSFREQIFTFLEAPILRYLPPESKLTVLGVADPFVLYLKVTALAGIFLVSPWLVYQLWCFVAPGLYKRERRWSLAFVLLGSFFFLSGGAFAYYIAFPFSVEFLLGMGERFDLQITADRYIRFMMTIILGLGMMFQMPILIFGLAQLGVVTPRFLMRHFRWAVLIIFVLAAVITPTPDVVNLCLFALPAIFLYLLGVGAAALVQRKSRKEREAEAEA